MSSVKASVVLEPLLTVKEVAALLRVSSSWVYDRASKDLPSVYVGGLLRFERSSIEGWLHRLPPHGVNAARPDRSAR
jgi:excisionase family DNA binding protein